MGWTGDLLAGVAQYAEDAGIAVWQPSGAYPADTVWPIYVNAMPPSPDRVVVFTPYGMRDDAGLTDTVQGLQLRFRGDKDPRTATDEADAFFDRLHGAEGLDLGGIHVVLIQRMSSTPLGPDANGRHEVSHNYAVTARRPSQHRID